VEDIDVQVAFGFDRKVDQAVPGYLLQHVLEERHAGIEACAPVPVQVDLDQDAGFQGGALHAGGALVALCFHGVGGSGSRHVERACH